MNVVWKWFSGLVGPFVSPYLVIGALVALAALFTWHKWEVRGAYKDGRAAVLLEQKINAARKNDDAETADNASRECQRNPACRLSNDGHRRD